MAEPRSTDVITYLPDRFNRCWHVLTRNEFTTFFFFLTLQDTCLNSDRVTRPGGGRVEGTAFEGREKKRRLYRFDGFARELTGVLCSVTSIRYRLIYAEIHTDKSVSSTVYPLHCDEPYPFSVIFYIFGYRKSTHATDAQPYGTVFVTIEIPLAAQKTRYCGQVSKREKNHENDYETFGLRLTWICRRVRRLHRARFLCVCIYYISVISINVSVRTCFQNQKYKKSLVSVYDIYFLGRVKATRDEHCRYVYTKAHVFW